MFKHNLLITFRNFKKNKSSFLINLIGLSTGLACTLLIYMWVMDELSVDQFHTNVDGLYQIMQKTESSKSDIQVVEWTPGLLAKALSEEFPEVEMASSVSNLGGTGLLKYDDKQLKARERYVSTNFFDLFTFPLLVGDKDEVLSDQKSVILSEEFALKLFGTTENIIGKTIDWERNFQEVNGQYIVSGVFENLPKHSTMQFDLLFSYDAYLSKRPELKKWRNSDPRTYAVLKKGTDITAFNTKIEKLCSEKDGFLEDKLFARKFGDRYLFGQYENGVQKGGRITYVRLFSIIALFILIIACINFMNLSTARATQRMKEVGVKKTIGAGRSTLVSQYLSESLLITFMSLIIAVVLVAILLPQFNEVTDKALKLTFDGKLLFGSIAIASITGLIAGSYPALYLSGFKPVNILKGQTSKSSKEVWARKGLVVFQFAMSLILIVSVFVVYQQIQFIQSKNLGYNKDNVVVIQKDGNLNEQTPVFLSELKNISGVVNASTIDGNLMNQYGYTTSLFWEGHQQETNPVRFGVMIVGKDILETLNLDLIAGESFTQSPDEGGYILNEAAAKVMGFENPVGQTVKRRREDHQIIGVVKNFHFESLYEKVKPCYLRLGNYGSNIVVKVEAGTEQETLASLEKLYGKFNPGLPFEYKFLDQNYDELYAAEHRVATLSQYFAGMAILISCLGLFGLAAFTAQRRMKEISIRKVLGASAFSIVRLLSADFTKMVLLATAIGLPISYWLSQYWLNDFAFHVDLSYSIFLWAGISVFVIAWLTVGLQTAKAAQVNPVVNLKE